MSSSRKRDGGISELSEEKALKESKPELSKEDKKLEFDPFDQLISRLSRTALTVNKLDYYGNVIPFGAFCNSVAFVLYGFVLCGVHSGEDYFLWSMIFFFGAIGQITAGLLEFIKGRTFPSTLYLTYGLYCLSHYFLKISDFKDGNPMKVFFGSWAGLTFPLLIGSIKTNLFYLIQSLATCAYCVIMCIGYCLNKRLLEEKVPGIILCIAGFDSLYIGVNQIINEQFRAHIIPAVPLSSDNEIDINLKSK